jgi:ferrous iron transport protein B
VVTDATALERNLNLALQVMEITDKVVVAVNLMDEARRKGITVDARSLSRDLGVPAIPITARTGEGMQTLLATVGDVISGQIQTKPLRVEGTPEVQRAVSDLSRQIEQLYPGTPNARWLAIRLLDGDARVQQAILSGEIAALVGDQQRADVSFSKKMAVEGRQ